MPGSNHAVHREAVWRLGAASAEPTALPSRGHDSQQPTEVGLHEDLPKFLASKHVDEKIRGRVDAAEEITQRDESVDQRSHLAEAFE